MSGRIPVPARCRSRRRTLVQLDHGSQLAVARRRRD